MPATITRSCTATLGCDQDSYTVTYYQLPFTIPSGATLTNQDYWKNYNGVEITARKRYSDRWMLNSSLALGTTPAHYGAGGYLDPTNIEFVNGAEENNRNAKWVFKLSGLYSFPWGINASAFPNARQGFPFFRDIRSPNRSGGLGRTNVKYEMDGTTRYLVQAFRPAPRRDGRAEALRHLRRGSSTQVSSGVRQCQPAPVPPGARPPGVLSPCTLPASCQPGSETAPTVSNHQDIR